MIRIIYSHDFAVIQTSKPRKSRTTDAFPGRITKSWSAKRGLKNSHANTPMHQKVTKTPIFQKTSRPKVSSSSCSKKNLTCLTKPLNQSTRWWPDHNIDKIFKFYVLPSPLRPIRTPLRYNRTAISPTKYSWCTKLTYSCTHSLS